VFWTISLTTSKAFDSSTACDALGFVLLLNYSLGKVRDNYVIIN